MVDASSKAGDGRGAPASSQATTTAPQPFDSRLIPGGRFDATPIGVNAVDREDLPSYGVSSETDYTATPEQPTMPPRE